MWGNGDCKFCYGRSCVSKEGSKKAKRSWCSIHKNYGWISKAVMEAVVSEANTYDLEVSCDLIHASKVTALDAAEAGVTWFEHASGFIQSIYPDWYPLAEQKARSEERRVGNEGRTKRAA